ncbi:uncharacterized protein BT62DRAFT_1010379 [Guyanagaster necrorhizus]|uniref:Uncharacterized protein n=1 Tax=Guyanagaster necrorhizus TaxID=856835 RepID=A0A9P8ANZ4_9AGAR|nr:uncharacterized protein BT62DRAFT_1010379 [Guyanagaster necrorhizus MCA 3950]KAG7442430.1 hypothetical protein BT62DRAFT_1010379 [Guyanagaster necrorhizus MCA 3950]
MEINGDQRRTICIGSSVVPSCNLVIWYQARARHTEQDLENPESCKIILVFFRQRRGTTPGGDYDRHMFHHSNSVNICSRRMSTAVWDTFAFNLSKTNALVKLDCNKI